MLLLAVSDHPLTHRTIGGDHSLHTHPSSVPAEKSVLAQLGKAHWLAPGLATELVFVLTAMASG